MEAMSLRLDVNGVAILGEKVEGIGKNSGKPFYLVNMDVVGASLPFFVEEKTFNQLTQGAFYQISGELISRNGDLHLRNETFTKIDKK